MTTELKCAANRENARKSTGPVTPEGKAASRMNALEHGAYAETVLLPQEDAAAFAELRDGLRKRFAPEGKLESLLVDRIAILSWRLGRVDAAEMCLLLKVQNDPCFWHSLPSLHTEPEIRSPGELLGQTVDVRGDVIQRIDRHEGSIERHLHRAVESLLRQRALRKAEFPSEPAAPLRPAEAFFNQCATLANPLKIRSQE